MKGTVRGRLPDLTALLDPAGRVPPGGLVFRPSLRAAVGSVLRGLFYLALLAFPPFVVGGAVAHPGVDAPAAVALLFALLAGTLPAVVGIVAAAVGGVLKVAFTRYALDGDGLHSRTTLLESKEERIPWEKVTAVRQRRTVFDSLLGVERLDVVSYGTTGRALHMVGLRDAAPLRDLVAARMRQSSSLPSLMRLD